MLALAVDEVVGPLREIDDIWHSARAVSARPISCHISKRASRVIKEPIAVVVHPVDIHFRRGECFSIFLANSGIACHLPLHRASSRRSK